MPKSCNSKSPRTTAVTTKLTDSEATRIKTRASDAGVQLSTFVRTALLKSRLTGTCVPAINQEAWTKLANLEHAVLTALNTPDRIDDVTLAAFVMDLASLRSALIGRAHDNAGE